MSKRTTYCYTDLKASCQQAEWYFCHNYNKKRWWFQAKPTSFKIFKSMAIISQQLHRCLFAPCSIAILIKHHFIWLSLFKIKHRIPLRISIIINLKITLRYFVFMSFNREQTPGIFENNCVACFIQFNLINIDSKNPKLKKS